MTQQQSCRVDRTPQETNARSKYGVCEIVKFGTGRPGRCPLQSSRTSGLHPKKTTTVVDIRHVFAMDQQQKDAAQVFYGTASRHKAIRSPTAVLTASLLGACAVTPAYDEEVVCRSAMKAAGATSSCRCQAEGLLPQRALRSSGLGTARQGGLRCRRTLRTKDALSKRGGEPVPSLGGDL